MHHSMIQEDHGMSSNPAMEKTYREYLEQIFAQDLKRASSILGFDYRDEKISVDFFSRNYLISREGISGPDGDRPAHSIAVVLSKYIILCPGEMPGMSGWVTYREFKDAAPFAPSFRTNTEVAIAKYFSGRLNILEEACRKTGGLRPDMDLPYQLVMKFTPLKLIPVILLFNDADEEFPAQSVILFEKRAEQFLDMECLAITGWLLADYLYEAAGFTHKTIM